MHFLTREWHSGALSDDQAEAAEAAFRAHQAAVAPRLPVQLRHFVQTVSVHDARVRLVQVDRPAATLTLDLRAGDLQVGYCDLTIRYEGVYLGGGDVAVLRAIAHNPEAEALYDEMDLAPGGRFEHRWLWWPNQYLSVTFSAFIFQVVPVPERPFQRSREPYVERGEMAG